MCGIACYKGRENASEIVLRCIKTLEYRGYDSIGMAVKNNSSITLKRGVGSIVEVDSKLNFNSMPGNIALAHTRWATTGAVTIENCHPHFSNDQKIYSVHNGIIENYQELKKNLEKEGINFTSETDSEIIPKYVSFLMDKKNSLREAARKTFLMLEGSFAIALISKNSEEIIIARKNSPLVIGIKDYPSDKPNINKKEINIDKINSFSPDIKTASSKVENQKYPENEYFIASDVPAFLEYTNKVIYLENDEYAVIDKDILISSIQTNQPIKKKIEMVEWNLEQAKKGTFDHFMIKEIDEQKYTIKKAAAQSPKLMTEVKDILDKACGIFFVGCGTSYHAAISSSYIFSHVAKKHVNVVLASEFRNYKEFITPKTVIVAISQSGETADVLDAVSAAKSKGAIVISIVNVMGSSLTRESNLNIMMNAGPEICVLSTKSYTSQLTILLLLAYFLAGKQEEGKRLIEQADQEVEKIIQNSINKLEGLAERIKTKKDIFLIGRDLAFPSALEGALKIKEVSYIHAEGFAGGELKHGTIALIEKKTPCIVFITEATKQMTLSNASEIKARGGHIIGIGSCDNEIFDDFIRIADLKNANPIAMIVPVQLLAYYLAIKRKCNPDKPRNLAKSVTVR
jgi:glutamine---fructose-6-phosphate transaminase (isomerizing)